MWEVVKRIVGWVLMSSCQPLISWWIRNNFPFLCEPIKGKKWKLFSSILQFSFSFKRRKECWGKRRLTPQHRIDWWSQRKKEAYVWNLRERLFQPRFEIYYGWKAGSYEKRSWVNVLRLQTMRPKLPQDAINPANRQGPAHLEELLGQEINL